MLAVLLISPQCVKNFSDNLNKIHQQILANFSEQLMNKTDFNGKIDFACYCLKCEVKIVFLFSKKVQKNKRCRAIVATSFLHSLACLATLRTLKHHLSKLS